MEKFLNLPIEKQNLIIDAALKTFATHGYKKTSISDIAGSAGISKAMVFHYFGTKKELYLYLVNTCVKSISIEVIEKFDDSITDLFDRILYTSKLKLSLMEKHPHVSLFIQNAYFENDDEVKEELKTIFSKSDGRTLGKKITFEGADFSKFKDDIDPNLVMNMIDWISEGYMSKMADIGESDFDELYKMFEECLKLFKKNFYK
ncbi:MAG: TetR/AcrR family transcriptional regulator [Alkaliphilus sp.]|nr:TetR/AcrR family transcriptional regulator [Alkaliphilus sp.]